MVAVALSWVAAFVRYHRVSPSIACFYREHEWELGLSLDWAAALAWNVAAQRLWPALWL
jgi:hypothetical protein